MKVQKKINGKFTLIEMLSAMGIFMIISVVMMQFFNSSQQLISTANQRNMVFTDARIAFDMITRDLQCALYRNDDVTTMPDVQDIYPFWFQRISEVTDATRGYSNLPWDSLNFIASTDIIDDSAVSNVCELRYSYVPAGQTFFNPDGNDIDGGWLIRSCTTDQNTTEYNFSANPLTNDVQRMNKIWVNSSGGAITEPAQQANASYSNFEEVIPNVYKLSFTCYNKSLDTTDMAAGGSNYYGTPFPTAIKIELELLGSRDWKMWEKLVNDSKQTEADKLLEEKLHRFSKIIYLPRKETL